MNPAPPERALRMNSAIGKQILSIVRDGDFAHPGEREAIECMFADLVPDTDRRLLDVGCGLGGTVEEVWRKGLGTIVGIDNDRAAIEYATNKYPQHAFVCGDAEKLSMVVSGPFDLIFMFNSFYTIEDQRKFLREAAIVSRKGGELRIFDYYVHGEDLRAKEFSEHHEGSRWQPIELEAIGLILQRSGWKLVESIDISKQYEGWYTKLVAAISSRRDEILAHAGREWFEYALRKYRGYLQAIQEGVVGGVILRATKLSNSPGYSKKEMRPIPEGA